MVINGIFDAWQYELLWTCTLTRLLWYTYNSGCLILTSCCIQQYCEIHFIVHSQVRSQDSLKCTTEHYLKYTPNFTQWYTPSLLDYTLWSKLSRCFQVHFKYALMYMTMQILKYTYKHALKDAPKCTPWHTLSYIYSQSSSEDAHKHTPQHALKYVSKCITWHSPSLLDSVLHPETSRVAPTRYQEAGGGCGGWVAYSGRNHNVSLYCRVSLFSIAPTATRSHKVSWTMTWQL